MFKKIIIRLFGVLLVLLLMIGASCLTLYWYANQPVISSVNVDFTIDAGDSLSRVAKNLESKGFIEYPRLFSIMGQILGSSSSLQAGDYQITSGLTSREILLIFTNGLVRYYDITFVEGLRFVDMVKQLNMHPKLADPMDEDDVKEFIKQLAINGSPEGLFYPDTYFFESGEVVKSILTRAYNRLNKVLSDEWATKAKVVPYKTPYESLILASVIEKETGVALERTEIAGVFVRRLQRGMRLQSDPTVIYGMGERYDGQLNRRMLREKTPYNTYVIKGLPPAPIALVGRDAIYAALHPAVGRSLYFVAKGDGTHYFSDSLAEHNKAVRKYQVSERRAEYRSSVNVN